MKNNDVIIIGAGPAGILAAVQLKRYNIESTLFEKSAVGGLLKNANLVENCPGFPDGAGQGQDQEGQVRRLHERLKSGGNPGTVYSIAVEGQDSLGN